MKPATALAVLLLTVVGVLHVLRLFTGTSVTFGAWSFPMSASAVGAVIALGLAWGVWREHRG